MASVTIPRELAEAVKRRGYDLESFIVEAVERQLELDPAEELETRLAVAEHMLRRGREELKKGDPIQASEKLYKAVEECIKILACLEGLEECSQARREGGWWTKLLSRAARRLARRLNKPLILEAWSQGYDLHVHGFHEHALTAEDVTETLPLVEELVAYTKNILEAKRRRK